MTAGLDAAHRGCDIRIGDPQADGYRLRPGRHFHTRVAHAAR